MSHFGTFSKICQENAHLSELFQRGGSLDDNGENNENESEENHIGPTYEQQISRESVFSDQSKQDQKSLSSQWKGNKTVII